MKRMSRVFATIAALMLLLNAGPAQAGLRFVVGVRMAPPPPRREYVETRAGAVWVRGHWMWSPMVARHIWVPGAFVDRRPGFIWIDGSWVRTRYGWMFIDGYWKRV